MPREQAPVYEFRWTHTGVATGVAPDEDYAGPIEIGKSNTIEIQADSKKLDGHSSTDWDLNAFVSPDNVEWDTVALNSEDGLGNDAVKTFSFAAKGKWIKFTLDNNAGGTDCYVVARVTGVAT